MNKKVKLDLDKELVQRRSKRTKEPQHIKFLENDAGVSVSELVNLKHN